MTTGAAARSLADELRGWDDAALVGLLRHRPDLLTPVPTDMAALAARAGSPPSVARALDQLDRGQLDVLEAVAVLPEPVSLETLRRGLPALTPEVIEAALDHAGARALIFGPPEDRRLVRAAVDALGPTPAGLGPAMAGSDPLLSELLGKPGAVEALLDEAPEGARAAVEHLAWGPPHGTVDNARRAMTDPDQARTPVDWLLAHHLLIPVAAETVVLPREVAMIVRGGVVHREARTAPPDIQVERIEPESVDRAAAGQAFSVVRLVESLLAAWGLDSPAVLRAGGLGVRDLKRTAAALDVDERLAALLIETAYASGLLAADGELDEAYAPTPAYDSWLTRETAERWVVLAQAWLAVPRSPGLVGTRDERDKALAALGPDLERPGAPDLRRTILAELSALAPGEAAGADAVLERLMWVRPRGGSRVGSRLVSWTLEEAELLGLSGRGALSAAGRAVLDGNEDKAEELLETLLPTPLDHVLLQADLTAVAPGPLESALAAELALLADVESTGGATVFRFTPASVRRALDAGRSASDVHALLSARSRTPVPQPLTYLVDDVARRHGQVRVGAAQSYLRCDDEATLNEIVADRRAAPLRLRRLAPTVVTSQVSVDQLLEGLRAMGQTPAAEAADGTVIVRRPDSRRTPPRQRPPRLASHAVPPGDTLLGAAVRAIRAGERASSAPRGRTVGAPLGGVLPRSTTADTLAALRAAIDEGASLWIGYVDTHGGVSERVVDPLRLSGGYLTAFDHRLDEMHTFAVHRITGVASLTGPGTGAESDVDALGSSTVGDVSDNGGSAPVPEGAA